MKQQVKLHVVNAEQIVLNYAESCTLLHLVGELTGSSEYENTFNQREPDYLTNSTNGDVTPNNTIGITQELLQTRFNEMAESVAKNKGFYIARYETSLEEGNAQSKKDKTVVRDLNWYNLYELEYSFSPKTDEAKGTISEMIWECQWGQMLLFLNSKARKDGIGNNFSITTYSSSRHVRKSKTFWKFTSR